MEPNSLDIKELHWMMDMLQTIDVGLVVLDREYSVKLWNNFMENHSGLRPDHVRNKSIFEIFPEIPQSWFRHKMDMVCLLKNRSFSTWEQRPRVFPFRNYRPITGSADFMYQNITIIPLVSVDGTVNHACIIVYDVTDTAVNKIQLQSANIQLENLSRTDALTQLANRGYWEECLVQEYSRFKRTGNISTLVMFDIDHFKQVNDTFGHPAGDAVIIKISDILRENLRDTDHGGRYGGEEFAVVLVDTNAKSARIFAERLRKQIEASIVIHDQDPIKVTVSLGLAESNEKMKQAKDWISRADSALYESKENGRNRTSIAT